MTTIDFNAAMAAAKRGGGFEPLPDGEYDLVCLEATPTTASTGKPMIKAKWQVEAGPHAGSKVFDQYVFSADNDNALSFFFQHMRHFGLDETFFSSNPSFDQVAAALPGRKCRMRLGQRTWDGRPRNEVLQIMPPSSPNPTAPAAGAVPGVPAAAPPVAPAVPTAPQVPQAPPAVVPAAPPQPPAQLTAPQPAPVAPAAPQPQVPAPAPQPEVPAATSAPTPAPAGVPPQPVFNPQTQQWELPQPAPAAPQVPAQVPTTPEEPF